MQHQNLITQIKKNSTEVYRIYEKEYEGYKFIDVRIYYMDKNSGEYKPTKKGISIMPNNVEEIRSEERRVGKECRSRWSPYH